MKRIIIVALLGLLLAVPLFGVPESVQQAVQNLWWTKTLCDTIAANDFNRWDLTASVVEVADFTSDQAGSLCWWNGGRFDTKSDSVDYTAPTTYWHFEADEVTTITAKGGLDSLEIHNTSGSAATVRLIGQRR